MTHIPFGASSAQQPHHTPEYRTEPSRDNEKMHHVANDADISAKSVNANDTRARTQHTAHTTDFFIRKRNNAAALFDEAKVRNTLRHAGGDITIDKTYIDAVVSRLLPKIRTGTVSSKQLHEALSTTVAALSRANADFSRVAARLVMMGVRKDAYGTYTPPTLFDHVTHMTERKLYSADLLRVYSKDDFAYFDAHIDHERDMTLNYAGAGQFVKKYLVSDRIDDTVYESPQFAFVCAAMTLFSVDTSPKRNEYIIRLYDLVSTYKVSFATPIIAGARTPVKQFSSCVLIECGDSLESIIANSGTLVRYVSRKAGIGINGGAIRAKGSPIRGGEAEHTGCVPFYQLFEKSLSCCSQGGVRKGSATLFYPAWHSEVETLLKLGDARTHEKSAARGMNYGIQLNGFLYRRLIEDDSITLFSPHAVPDLYEAFFADQDEFARLYVAYEQDATVRKTTLRARDLFRQIGIIRASTGRLFIQHVDHCNTHSAFDPSKAPIRQSNLCMEITLPTAPLDTIDDADAEVALCTLSSVNLGQLRDLDELGSICEVVVRTLDNLLSYQEYPVPAARNATEKRRALGIGISGMAHYLAKNGLDYSGRAAAPLVHRTFEALQFHCLRASNALAKERGPCGAYTDTTYARGQLPIDTYQPRVDDICNEPLKLDWEDLRESIRMHGLRNSTLTAVAPTETSSQITDSTPGFDPVRALEMARNSRSGNFYQAVPDLGTLREQYEVAKDMPDNIGLLELTAVAQKFVDQSISVDTHYNLAHYQSVSRNKYGRERTEERLPLSLLLRDMLYAHSLGIKTLYYHNNYSKHIDDDERESCAGGACSA